MNPKAIDDMSMAMADVYAAVTDRILINLAHHFPYVQTNRHIGSWEYQTMMLAQMGKVEKETIAIIAQSLGGADEALKQALETAILQGLKNEEPKLRQAAMNGLLKPNGYVSELDPSQLQAFTAYYRQSADKLNLVNTVMLDSTRQAYQATVADVAQKIANTQGIMNAAAGEVITGVSSWNGAMHSAVQKMVANGITGFIDHAGHKWSPEAYVAMDIKTTMFNTARAAVWERSEQYGSDLYQISSHNGARPLCYPWQGKVLSRSGWTGIVKDLDGNEVQVHSQEEVPSFGYGGGPFGVNCGHYPMAFIPNFSSLKGESQDPETNAKEYAESQQQRALERRLREEKRDLEVMKAQGAPADQIKAQREKVRSASADIDQFCDETGRARKRNREYAPVNAEFPDANKMQQTAKPLERPANEQEVLKQFNMFDTQPTDAEILAGCNPLYDTDGRKWNYNCQRTVVAEELRYRGYNVTAMPYDPKDAIKDNGWAVWDLVQPTWKDPWYVDIESKKTFTQTVKETFDKWGDGSRAVVRLKYDSAHGNNGHFIFARRSGDAIIFSDPQTNEFIKDIEKEYLDDCTRGRHQFWLMRVDNRELNDKVALAVKNVME